MAFAAASGRLGGTPGLVLRPDRTECLIVAQDMRAAADDFRRSRLGLGPFRAVCGRQRRSRVRRFCSGYFPRDGEAEVGLFTDVS